MTLAASRTPSGDDTRGIANARGDDTRGSDAQSVIA
jgi:hypothetical protein